VITHERPAGGFDQGVETCLWGIRDSRCYRQVNQAAAVLLPPRMVQIFERSV
jgi:hypothetical protein